VNLVDIFTKEMNDTKHFVELQNLMICHHFMILIISSDCYLL
jgi:hypothetical protein